MKKRFVVSFDLILPVVMETEASDVDAAVGNIYAIPPRRLIDHASLDDTEILDGSIDVDEGPNE